MICNAKKKGRLEESDCSLGVFNKTDRRVKEISKTKTRADARLFSSTYPEILVREEGRREAVANRERNGQVEHTVSLGWCIVNRH